MQSWNKHYKIVVSIENKQDDSQHKCGYKLLPLSPVCTTAETLKKSVVRNEGFVLRPFIHSIINGTSTYGTYIP